MDLIVTPSDDNRTWMLTDLLGRSMGVVVASSPDDFMIRPDGPALNTMAKIVCGPYPSLDAALAEIEKHTRGVCRRSPDKSAPPRAEG